jgi:hypothetical protein
MDDERRHSRADAETAPGGEAEAVRRGAVGIRARGAVPVRLQDEGSRSASEARGVPTYRARSCVACE